MARVALCICTCDRPRGLARTLAGVHALDFDGALRIVVADNHAGAAGERVCAALPPGFRFPVSYVRESRRGISFARNAALRAALADSWNCEFVAMLDDDGRPDARWLAELLAAQARTGADIVCGPIEPEFEGPAPGWIERGGYFSCGAAPRTSNALFRAEALRARSDPWFDPRLALSGGEDVDLIEDMVASGRRFAAADAALVREIVPGERMRARYLLARALRYGAAGVRIQRLRGRGRRSERLATALSKAGYGLNHLLWSAIEPWRLLRAAEDFAEGGGMLLGEFGFEYEFYAVAHGEPRRWRRQGARAG